LTATPVKTAAVTVITTEFVTDPDTAVIVVWPAEDEVARPLPLIVATACVEELQVTEFVRFCVLPSLYDPVAVNAWAVPATMLGLGGVMVMAVRIAGVTVSSDELTIEPALAVIVAWPADIPFASPPGAMVATAAWEELQVTDVVRSWVLPSLKVPAAVYGWVVPAAMDGACGFTCNETRVGTTLKPVEPISAPKAAVIVAFPTATAAACPLPFMLTTAGFEELQVAEVVRSWAEPSL
jgi:hypothetical protein